VRPQVRLLGQFQTQPSYTDTAANNDFAVVTLAQPVGRQTGWLGLEFSQAAEVDVDLTTAGARPSMMAKCHDRAQRCCRLYMAGLCAGVDQAGLPGLHVQSP